MGTQEYISTQNTVSNLKKIQFSEKNLKEKKTIVDFLHSQWQMKSSQPYENRDLDRDLKHRKINFKKSFI